MTVREEEGALLFDVVDDGAGFDLATGAHHGHGFVNMGDRVGRHRRQHLGRVGTRTGHRDPRPDPARPVAERQSGRRSLQTSRTTSGPNCSLCT